MKNFALAAALVLACCMQVSAQLKPEYAVANIPDSLRKNANAILQQESIQFTINGPGKGKETIRKVITVFNNKADDLLTFYAYTDKFVKIDDIELNIYDQNGIFIKKSRKRDLHQQSAYDGFSIVTDGKIIYASLNPGAYPVTMEINYEVNYDGFIEFKDFTPSSPEYAIQKREYTITTDTSNRIRYKNYLTSIKPAITQNGNSLIYKWSVAQVPALKRETGAAKEDYPTVFISPTRFNMDDYGGNMSTWASYGEWQTVLNKGTDVFNPEQIRFYQNLVAGAATERDKVRILYQYLQENFRYVSIQLGIGGMKPFPASYVEKNKFGDCKALSNYMLAMLKANNIKSHYALINAGERSMAVDKDFPQDRFNHVILCVPLSKDTIWLECTSRSQPFGVLGNFTENRNALLITDKGGILTPTPRSKADANRFAANTLINMAEDGSGTATFNFTYNGDFSGEYNAYLFDADEQYRLRFLHNRLGLKQPDQLKMEKSQDKASHSSKVSLELTFEKIPEFSTGSKHFLNGRIYKFLTNPLSPDDNRRSDYYFDFPSVMDDTTVYKIPEGYTVESLPARNELRFSYGSYTSNYTWNETNRTLTGICHFQLDYHIVPSTQYNNMLRFFSDLAKDQQQKIIIKKQAP